MSLCVYCKKARGTERDHLVPKYLRLRFPEFEEDEWIVSACHDCNGKKYTFRFVDEGHEDKIPYLKEVTSYTFLIYRGERISEMFRDVVSE